MRHIRQSRVAQSALADWGFPDFHGPTPPLVLDSPIPRLRAICELILTELLFALSVRLAVALASPGLLCSLYRRRDFHPTVRFSRAIQFA